MFSIRKKEVQIGIMLLIAGGIIYFLIKIKMVLLPFIFGIILAYLFYPIISFLKERNFSRLGAIYILTIMFLFFICLTAFVIFPIFFEELEGLTVMIPKYSNSIEEYFDFLSQEYRRVQLPAIIKEAIDQALIRVEEIVIGFIQNLTEMILNSLPVIFSLLIAPIITYYLLKDLDKIKRNFLRYIPKEKRRLVLKLGIEINKIFVGYLRGLIWVSIIVGILSSIGLFIFKVRFFLILGIFSGITNMIPYIGPIIGGIPAVFIALLSSPLKALGVIILYVFIQQVESSIIGPKIMSEKVGLHPLTVIFALLAGAELIGTWGLIFAVPLAGSIKVIVRFIWQELNW